MEIKLIFSLICAFALANHAFGTSNSAETGNNSSPKVSLSLGSISSQMPPFLSLSARLARKFSLFLSQPDSPASGISPEVSGIRLREKMWAAVESEDFEKLANMFGYRLNLDSSFNPLFLPIAHFNENKPDINGKKDGDTPLLYAVQRSPLLLARTIIAMGADVNMENDSQTCNPLTVAIDNNKHEIVRTLLAHKADPNVAPANGHLPIWHALQKSTYALSIIAPHVRTYILGDNIAGLRRASEIRGYYTLTTRLCLAELRKTLVKRLAGDQLDESEVLPALEAPGTAQIDISFANGELDSDEKRTITQLVSLPRQRKSSQTSAPASPETTHKPKERLPTLGHANGVAKTQPANSANGEGSQPIASTPNLPSQKLPKTGQAGQGKKAKAAAKSKTLPNGKLPPIAKANGKSNQ